MWELWSKALESLGRFRLRRFGRGKTKIRVGDPTALDAQGGGRWASYLEAEKLYDTWGPVVNSPWIPFHCVPLFAALDRIPRSDIGPMPGPEASPTTWTRKGLVMPAHGRPGAPAPLWVTPNSWTIVDMPGPQAVEAAAWLITSARCQPVCTFDNWPHPKGVLKAEDTLAELLRWAAVVDDARWELTSASPPLWICDSERLGTRAGSPGQFDNRYYLDDSVLPGVEMLVKNDIRIVNYVTFAEPEIPTLDLEMYFADLLKSGIEVRHIELADPTLEPRPMAAPIGPRPVPRDSFRRSAAGGFGSEVPQPSSGGG